MPMFEAIHPVTGDTLEIESDLPPTEEEKQRIFKEMGPPPVGRENILQGLAQTVNMATGVPGIRGLGVLAQRGLAGDSASEALGRASEAVKPGYKPAEGEKIGAGIGEAAAALPLSLATGGGGFWPQVLKGALTAGSLTAVQEAADRGDVEPVDVITSATFGGAIPAIGPSMGLIKRVVKGTGTGVAKSGTNLSKEVVAEMEKNPKMLEMFEGTAFAVKNKVADIQKAIVAQHDKAADILGKARESIGFREPFKDVAKRIQAEGFKPAPIQELLADFAILEKKKIPVAFIRQARQVRGLTPGKKVTSGVTGSLGEEAMEYESILRKIPEKITVKTVDIPPKARLRDLYRLRQKVGDIISQAKWKQQAGEAGAIGTENEAFVKTLYNKINKIIEGVPGGKELREADHIYTASRKLFDDFQKRIATKGKAEDFVRKILMGGDVEDMIGEKGEYVALLRLIEKKTKTSLIAPAKGELASQELRGLAKTGWTGLPAEALGPTGVMNLLTGTRVLSKAPEAAEKVTGSPTMKALLRAAASRKPEER